MSAIGGAEIHVGLTGPTKSGKTNLFIDLARCIELGFHGFERGRGLSIDPPRAYRELIRSSLKDPPGATRTAKDISFQLGYRPDGPAQDVTRCTVHVRDAPGGAAFSQLTSKDVSIEAEKEKLDAWFRKAAGVVLVISVLEANKFSGFLELLNKVEDFFQKAGEPEFERLERVVVAISMFDLLMLRFGPHALAVATDPKAVLAILHAHMRPAFDLVKDFRPFSQTVRQLDLRFVATSSYGFHPGFGCPNVETQGAVLDLGKERYAEPLHPEKKRYPYMTADPFVFAAVGLDSPFLFTREEILNGAARKRQAA